MELNKPNEILKTDPPKSKTSRIGKRWKMVSTSTHPNHLKEVNETIMRKYYSILQIIKEQYLKPGTTYFERDYQHDTSDPLTLHCFICDQIYFYLECDWQFIMQIQYDFHNFQFDAEVLKLLSIPINSGKCIRKPQQPTLPDFFKRVKNYQLQQYIKTL